MNDELNKASERFRETAMRILREGQPPDSGLSMERMSEDHLKRTHQARLLRKTEEA